MVRSSVFTAATYFTPEESSYSQGVTNTVENSMKKHTDNVTRFLEGISSRLSQLELYCYNLDKLIGEMHSDWVRDCGESDSKLRSLEKHIQEVCAGINFLFKLMEANFIFKFLFHNPYIDGYYWTLGFILPLNIEKGHHMDFLSCHTQALTVHFSYELIYFNEFNPLRLIEN